MTRGDSIVFIDSDLIYASADLNEIIRSHPDRLLCITTTEIFNKIDPNTLRKELSESDIIHGGLKFEGAIAFTDLQILTFNWNFLIPDRGRDSYTWRATSDLICFDTKLVEKMNGFVSGLSVNASIMEFCYRALMAGASVKYSSNLVEQNLSAKRSISKSDNLYFARHHLGEKHYLFLRIYYLLFGLSLLKIRVNSAPPKLDEKNSYQFKIKAAEKVRSVGTYTAIIPTIDRYDYIDKSIQSLLKYPFPPDEIIVVDQSPKAERQHAIYEPYIAQGLLKVFYLDIPGQCTSRNLAIEAARNEWLLFFEDDTEAWPEMMKEHIELMEYSQADVSTGVSLAPWKDVSYISDRLKKYHIADVLATGNCFMLKQTALSVGGLHPAFNRGSGADDDFGKRLFLAGKSIVFNYKAIQTHHKAAKGGMRVHGAWWRNSSKLFQAYPPPTQMYMIKKYYSKKIWPVQIVLFYIQSRKGQSVFKFLFILLLAPLKIFRSLIAAKKLTANL